MKNDNRNQEALTDDQLQAVTGGRQLGQASLGDIWAPDQGAGNLSGDVHPEPDGGKVEYTEDSPIAL